MARQKLGPKKVNRLKIETGLPVVHVLVRGGTNHRRDLCLDDGTIIHLYNDGTMAKSKIGWNINKG